MSNGFSFTDDLEDFENNNSSDADNAADEVLGDILGYKKQAQSTPNEELNIRDKAIQQMEHANLYRVLLENKIFKAGSARPSIQELVETEIKEFIEGKLCELLNIGTPKKKTSIIDGFSEKEVTALKILVSKIASKLPDSQEPSQPKQPELNTASVSKKQQRAPKPQLTQIDVSGNHEEILNTVSAPNEQVKVKTPDDERSKLLARQREISQGTQKVSKNPKRKPMPSVQQQMMKIEADRRMLEQSQSLSTVSETTLDRDQLSRAVGYNKG